MRELTVAIPIMIMTVSMMVIVIMMMRLIIVAKKVVMTVVITMAKHLRHNLHTSNDGEDRMIVATMMIIRCHAPY